jgi:hypothetical protein
VKTPLSERLSGTLTYDLVGVATWANLVIGALGSTFSIDGVDVLTMELRAA